MAKADQQVLNLIEEVNKQKSEIAKLDKPNWKTNCSFSYGYGNSINLHVENDVRNLVKIAAFLLSQESDYKSAVQSLSIDAPSNEWGGFKIEEWLDDIKLRIAKIQISTKKKKLEALENRLNSLISPELRAQLELESIMKELKG